jgi:acetolactate synthase-1/2/3 large subunit
MEACEALVHVLVAGGVRYFAGMAGSTVSPFIAAAARAPGARYVPVRHEHVAASLLDATARLTGRPGCVLVHSAAGTLAASLGVAAAARESSPLIVLTGTQERLAQLRGYSQTMDVLAPLRAMAKWQVRVERPQDVAEIGRRALLEATYGRPGVVQIDFPADLATVEIDPPPPAPDVTYLAPLFRSRPLAVDVDRAVALLRAARRPTLVVGGGAAYSGAGNELQRLAEQLCAPIVNSATSRGVVPEDHPLSLGPSGIVGDPACGNAIRTADLLLAIGSRLSDIQTARGALLPTAVPIIQVNVDASEIGRVHPVALGIAADARAFLEDLNQRLDEAELDVPDERREWARGLRRGADDWYAAWLAEPPDNGKLQPQEIVRSLAELLPADAVLSYGAGDHTFYGTTVPARGRQRHLVSSALGTMGSGLAYALGAKLVHPDRPSVACLGDGELMLHLGDLETMVREDLPLVVIVSNNFRLGSQHRRLEARGYAAAGDHGNPDFARLAELFGCDGYRVDRPGQLRAALERALASGRPAVIDALVDPETAPPGS